MKNKKKLILPSFIILVLIFVGLFLFVIPQNALPLNCDIVDARVLEETDDYVILDLNIQGGCYSNTLNGLSFSTSLSASPDKFTDYEYLSSYEGEFPLSTEYYETMEAKTDSVVEIHPQINGVCYGDWAKAYPPQTTYNGVGKCKVLDAGHPTTPGIENREDKYNLGLTCKMDVNLSENEYFQNYPCEGFKIKTISGSYYKVKIPKISYLEKLEEIEKQEEIPETEVEDSPPIVNEIEEQIEVLKEKVPIWVYIVSILVFVLLIIIFAILIGKQLKKK